MKKGLALLGLVMVGASSQAMTIDDFMTGSYNSGAIVSGTVNSWTSAGSAIGGIRYQSLSVISNPLGGDAKCRVITAPGVLDVSSDSDVDIDYTLGYGYAASSTLVGSNPLNSNFTSIPIIDLNFRTNDLTLPVTVILYTNGGANSFSRTVNVNAGIFSASPLSYQFDFTADAASLGDVDGIKIYFDPAAGGDFSLNGIQAVPEPMSVLAVSLGAIALLRRRKK
jgi:hypothetical protein